MLGLVLKTNEMEGTYMLVYRDVYCDNCKNLASKTYPNPPHKCKRCKFEIVLCSKCESIRCPRCGGKMKKDLILY